jgi:phospholipase C
MGRPERQSQRAPAGPCQRRAGIRNRAGQRHHARAGLGQHRHIFLAWDDWGGFYDHVTPPSVDANGYGLRVPGIVISPYAKTGYIDHQTLSFDAYLKFIEDDFLDGARIDPATDGRPDSRPDVRENAPQLGDLTQDFDFSQPPRAPLVLAANP